MKTFRTCVAAFLAFFTLSVAGHAGQAGGPRAAPPPAPALAVTAPTHVAFVLYVSESMRDPTTKQVKPIVGQVMLAYLASNLSIRQVAFVDADGKPIGEPGEATNANSWREVAGMGSAINRLMAGVSSSNPASPIAGIAQAFQILPPDGPNVRSSVCIIGADFDGLPEPVLRRVEELNPRRAGVMRRARIDAIQVPLVPRGTPAPANGVRARFADLMKALTLSHDGTLFVFP